MNESHLNVSLDFGCGSISRNENLWQEFETFEIFFFHILKGSVFSNSEIRCTFYFLKVCVLSTF